MTEKRRIVGMSVSVVLAVIIIGWLIYGHPVRQVPYYPSNEPSHQTAPAIPVSTSQPIATQTTAPDIVTAPAAPTHYYSMEEDGEYGYEGAISEDDKNAGQAVKPIVMFRYLGEKDGTYTIRAADGPMSQTMSCKLPCEFIKLRSYYAGTLGSTETVRATGHSIMEAALHDAIAGELKPYRPTK